MQITIFLERRRTLYVLFQEDRLRTVHSVCDLINAQGKVINLKPIVFRKTRINHLYQNSWLETSKRQCFACFTNTGACSSHPELWPRGDDHSLTRSCCIHPWFSCVELNVDDLCSLLELICITCDTWKVRGLRRNLMWFLHVCL